MWTRPNFELCHFRVNNMYLFQVLYGQFDSLSDKDYVTLFKILPHSTFKVWAQCQSHQYILQDLELQLKVLLTISLKPSQHYLTQIIGLLYIAQTKTNNLENNYYYAHILVLHTVLYTSNQGNRISVCIPVIQFPQLRENTV